MCVNVTAVSYYVAIGNQNHKEPFRLFTKLSASPLAVSKDAHQISISLERIIGPGGENMREGMKSCLCPSIYVVKYLFLT